MSELSLTSPEKEHIFAEIAQLAGLKPSEVSKIEVAILASRLVLGSSSFYLDNQEIRSKALELERVNSPVQDFILHLKQKYLPSIYKVHDTNDITNFPRKVAETVQQFLQLAEALLDLEINHYSYGDFFPSYLDMLISGFGSEHLTTDSKTLLVGALTTDTVIEYQQLMNKFFPGGQALTIDLEGLDTPKYGQFVYADALHIATKSDLFNVVQTNLLLHQLVDGQTRTTRKTAQKRVELFKEFYRVLKPGGIITLIEGDLEASYLGSNLSRVILLMINELEEAGFVNIRLGFAKTFSKKISILGSTNKLEINNQPVKISDDCLQIYAEKPTEEVKTSQEIH